jgi:CRP/FNR family transcriptional regulator, cyclic AMP receptor protein
MANEIRPQAARASQASPRPLDDVPEMAEAALTLMHTPNSVQEMSADDIKRVMRWMRLVTYPAGATLLLEGDQEHTQFMLLLLEGEVSVDVSMATGMPPGTVPLSVVGPGQFLGDLSLLDGAPRSATCTAVGQVRAAALSLQAFKLLVQQEPTVACGLLLGIAQRTGERLRALSEQLGMYARVVSDQHATIEGLRAGSR